MKRLTKNIVGKLFGDRGYIGKPLFNFLWQRGIQLITKLRQNMANRLMPLMDKLLEPIRILIVEKEDHLLEPRQGVRTTA